MGTRLPRTGRRSAQLPASCGLATPRRPQLAGSCADHGGRARDCADHEVPGPRLRRSWGAGPATVPIMGAGANHALIDTYHSGMGSIRPWHIAVLIVVLMILGGLIGSVLWSTSRNNRKQ
jgi:hypothetical protein